MTLLRPRSFRLVCADRLIPRVEDLLRAEGYAFEQEPFSSLCRRLLAEPRPLGRSWANFFGYIYIQDRSSMLPPLALAPKPGSRVLDMCASPGSKSGFLAQLTGSRGFVLANEPSRARLATLRANLARMNLLQVGTSGWPGERLPLPGASWQAILLDAPCSGWGTAEKHPEALKMWRPQKLGPLLALQRALLGSAARLLAPGGLLLYSTCTTNRAENEDQALYARNCLGLELAQIPDFPGFGRQEAPGCPQAFRVDGQASGGQGFFLALLRRPGLQAQDFSPPDAGAPAEGSPLDPAQLRAPGCDPARLPPGQARLFGNRVRFLPEASQLPGAFAWQGAPLGRLSASRLLPEPRLRCLFPGEVPAAGALVLDELEDLTRLLSGQSLACGRGEGWAELWWRELPLGLVRRRGSVCVARFGPAPESGPR